MTAAPVTGLILSGGGARAAYQVGVLAAIAELLPAGAANPFPVLVGTSAGAIYHHFSGKNAVVVEVARSAISIPLAALKEYLDRPASPAQLASYAMSALELAPELGELLAQLGAGAITDDALGRRLRAEFSMLRDSVEETMQAWARLNDVPAARIEGYSQLLVGLTLGYASQRVLVEGFDERVYLKQAVALLRLPEETPQG